jgi:PucR C-terminal helix-turn-helix domain/GGDEF-like domain
MGEHHAPPVPAVLLNQARLAARHGIGLNTVLRRYCAGYGVLHELLIEQAERGGIGGAELGELLRGQATLFDGLLATVSDEHERESARRTRTVQQRRFESVKRLLSGDLIDASALDYEFERHHLGMVGYGTDAASAVRELAHGFDRHLLLVQCDGDRFWGWLGSRRRIEAEAVAEFALAVASVLSDGEILAIGEPGTGFAGWCLTHRQAKAGLLVARAAGTPVVRYSEVALLAAILQDDVVATSLRELYLNPLERGADGGEVLRDTLKAYFAAGGHTSSAAATLGVSRRTISNRLRDVEDRLGSPVEKRAGELQVALMLAEVDDGAVGQVSTAA